MKITPPWDIVELEHELNFYRRFRSDTAFLKFNKKGDLVCSTNDKHGPQKLVKTTHELQPYCHPQSGDNYVFDMAIDEDETVHVATCHRDPGFNLSVYSAAGRNKDESTVKFVHNGYIAGIAITDNKNIVIAEKHFDGKVYVFNRNRELKSSFNPRKDSAPDYFAVHSVSVSSNNEIVLVTSNDNNDVLKEFYRLSTYTQDGKF